MVQLPPVPIMHWRLFAELVGLEEGACRGLCEKGHLPTITVGRHRMINLARLNADCLKVEAADD